MLHWRCEAFQVCSNDDPKMTLTYLTSMSNLLPYAFEWDFFQKLIFLILWKPKSLFSLDMLNVVSTNKFQRSRLAFGLSAEVSHIGVPPTY